MDRSFRNRIFCSQRAVGQACLIARVCNITTPQSTFHFSSPMSSPQRKSPRLNRAPRKQRKCGNCDQIGHDRRNCPLIDRQRAVRVPIAPPAATNVVQNPEQPPPFALVTTRDPSNIDWDKVLYAVFDLETTGLHRRDDEIIELAAVILDHFGIHVKDASFCEYIKPYNTISSYITNVNHITMDDVADAERFPVVADAFIKFMQQYADESTREIEHVIMVGHNARVFDIPFFVHQLSKSNMANAFFADKRFGFAMDTMVLAKMAVNDNVIPDPSNFQLQTFHQFVTGKNDSNLDWHRALNDAKATATILRFQPSWDRRKRCVFEFVGHDDQERPDDDHADDDSALSIESSVGGPPRGTGHSSDEDEEDEEERTEVAGDRWDRNTDYNPSDPHPTKLFETFCTNQTVRTSHVKLGLQCNRSRVNTPIRAWREVFKDYFLEKIVGYTNEYGRLHAKRWIDIDRHDLERFICVLFLSGIQKRKDKPVHWWSEDPMLENPIMKKIMSGRKFFTILRYLHCCPAENQDRNDPNYDACYKISEMKNYLEKRYDALFIPGQQLSLDETLLRAFGRIKFKVRIISKSARYGIKVYVLTDAVTAFVLRVLIYTGKSTYYSQESEAQQKKKTVDIVEQLVEPYKGSHRTIFIDRFYTSIELLQSLSARDLYVTGTMNANRIPTGLRLAKSSRDYKAMKRGDMVKFKFTYKVGELERQAGMVGWKDRNMVYCLSNDSNNHEMDECTRRGANGLLKLPRPISIANYNKYMGGVDLADMRRLHCNSTLMGQNRWWLKLFFYLLDVGTSNSLIIHNEARKLYAETQEYKPMNIVTFKMKVVESLLGKKTEDLLNEPNRETVEQHVAVHLPENTRYRCAFCNLQHGRSRRTRYKCLACDVPLCTMGNGRNNDDCFALAHKSEEIRLQVCNRATIMQRMNRSEAKEK